MLKRIVKTAVLLTLFAVLGAGLLAFSFQLTHQRIKANERAILLRTLNLFIPTDQYDNDLLNDKCEIQDEVLLGTNEPTIIYRARKKGQPIAAILSPIAPDGYNGPIHLLVGINYEGILQGVRVLSHQETPGLGDNIDIHRSNWILSFNGHALNNPNKQGWKIKQEGGIFDQFTGASITPRAIVKAIYNTLRFYQRSRDEIFTKNFDNGS